MNQPYKAFLFDLNGTMIDDMDFHIEAWFQILNEDLKANLNLAEVKTQMYGKNSELLKRVFGDNHFTEEEITRLSIEKEKKYQTAFRPHLKLINGLEEFLQMSYQFHVKMAIGSAAIPFNIDFVLDNLNIRGYFDAIVSADDVKASKPDPETYLKAASLLRMDPSDCIVFEDAPKGVEAAASAGMDCVVITTMHSKEEFKQYPNILYFMKDYDEPGNSIRKKIFPDKFRFSE